MEHTLAAPHLQYHHHSLQRLAAAWAPSMPLAAAPGHGRRPAAAADNASAHREGHSCSRPCSICYYQAQLLPPSGAPTQALMTQPQNCSSLPGTALRLVRMLLA